MDSHKTIYRIFLCALGAISVISPVRANIGNISIDSLISKPLPSASPQVVGREQALTDEVRFAKRKMEELGKKLSFVEQIQAKFSNKSDESSLGRFNIAKKIYIQKRDAYLDFMVDNGLMAASKRLWLQRYPEFLAGGIGFTALLASGALLGQHVAHKKAKKQAAIQIQALARGHAVRKQAKALREKARKKEEEKKKAETKEMVTDILNDIISDIPVYTPEQKAAIPRMQALARGRAARKLVAARRKEREQSTKIAQEVIADMLAGIGPVAAPDNPVSESVVSAPKAQPGISVPAPVIDVADPVEVSAAVQSEKPEYVPTAQELRARERADKLVSAARNRDIGAIFRALDREPLPPIVQSAAPRSVAALSRQKMKKKRPLPSEIPPADDAGVTQREATMAHVAAVAQSAKQTLDTANATLSQLDALFGTAHPPRPAASVDHDDDDDDSSIVNSEEPGTEELADMLDMFDRKRELDNREGVLTEEPVVDGLELPEGSNQAQHTSQFSPHSLERFETDVDPLRTPERFTGTREHSKALDADALNDLLDQ